jgi:Pregnancy-associated plasma protein-A
MKKLIFMLFFLNVISVEAQEKPRACGTKTPKTPYRISSQNMATFLQNEAQLSTPLCIKLYFTVFAENNGSSRATLDSEIYRQLQNTVNQYAPHGICFVLGGIRQINNSDLNFQDAGTEEDELDPYKVAGYLNVFVHLNLVDGASLLNGIAYDIPNTGAYISLVGSTLDDTNNLTTMAHELGHVFGLYHTFEPAFGAESVSRTNSCKDCDDDGDLLCSTPADPDDANNYLGNNTTNPGCVYTGAKLDECNAVYMPDVTNIMAYGLRSCRNNFTSGQGDRMRYVLVNNSPFLVVIAHETYTEFGSQTYSSGVWSGIGRDLYHVFPNGGIFTVNGTANFTMQAKKVQINSNARFSPSNGGRIHLKPNLYCN